MSTFEGRMKEYRLVSLDRFDGDNLSSTVYFLSHMHSDHTVGLDQGSFLSRLKQRGNSYLYCSEITRILLLGNTERYGRLAPYVKALETLCPTTIDIPAACDKDKNTTVLVTLLPAAHCPGSVMFLFEGDEGNVLYTGDFRWGMSEATQMPYLDPSSKPLRSIYVDTTFCCPKSFYIPSREQCESGVISLVQSHFEEYGSTGHVWIESRTSFGHEMLLKEISLKMKMKIHVAHWKKVLYDQIPGLKDIFTEDPEETRIHAHPKDRYKRLAKDALPCGYVPPNNKMNLIQIKPSTMWFTILPEIVNIVQQHGVDRYRACYSFHSSYAEIRDLVQFLKPARVFPSVIPTSKKFDEVQNTLNSFLTTPHYKHFSSVESEEQPLGLMKISKASFKDSVSVEDCAFDDTQSHPENSQEETSILNSQSSYERSQKSDSELDLYSDAESKNLSQTSKARDEPKENSIPLEGSVQSSSSVPNYIEDNSDDSEYEEEMTQKEDFKSQIIFYSLKSGDENKECVETSMTLAEKNEGLNIKDLSGPACTLKPNNIITGTLKSDNSSARALKSDNIMADMIKPHDSPVHSLESNDSLARMLKSDNIMADILKPDDSPAHTLKSDNIIAGRSKPHKSPAHSLESDDSLAFMLKSDDIMADILKPDDSPAHTLKSDNIIAGRSKPHKNPAHSLESDDSLAFMLKSDDIMADILKPDDSPAHTLKSDNIITGSSKPHKNPAHSLESDDSLAFMLKSDDIMADILKPDDSPAHTLKSDNIIAGGSKPHKNPAHSLESDDSLAFMLKSDDIMADILKPDDSPAHTLKSDNIIAGRSKPHKSPAHSLESDDSLARMLKSDDIMADILKPDISPAHALKSDVTSSGMFWSDAGVNNQENKTESDSLEEESISNATDNCNRQVDGKEEIGAKRSKDKIDLRKIFGSPNSFFEQLINSESSPQSLSPVFVLSKNSGDNCSESETNVLKQTNNSEKDTDNQEGNPVSDVVNSCKSINSVNPTKTKAMGDNEQRESYLAREQKENTCRLVLKLPDIEGRLFASTPKKRAGTDNEREECSQEKYCKTDLSLSSMKVQSNRIPLEEIDKVEADCMKEVLQMKSESANTSKCQEGHNSKEKLVTSPGDSQSLNLNSRFSVSATDEAPKKNKELIKCDNKPSSFKNNQSLNPEDSIPLGENCHSSFGNTVRPINSSSLMTQAGIKIKEHNVVREIKSLWKSTKSDESIQIIKESKLLVEISDSDDNDDCITINSDSDQTIPPSPNFLDSSQELFNSSNTVADPSNVSDSSDNDGVVIIETHTPIQNGHKNSQRKERKKSIIQLD